MTTTDELSVPESCEKISPERLEQARAAFSLKMRGNTQEQIASELGISRSTVIRLLSDYKLLYTDQLNREPRLHLLANELAKLDEIESTARKDGEQATSNRDKQSYLKIALAAMTAKHSLMIDTGILPKDPTRLVSVTCKVDGIAEPTTEDTRTLEEIRADVERLLRTGRRL